MVGGSSDLCHLCVGIGQFIAFVINLDSFYEIMHKSFNFLMLEGVWMIVGTAKIFAKQNGGRLVEIVISAPFDATQGLLPCYNRDKALSPETCVVNQPEGIGSGAVRYFPEAVRPQTDSRA